MANDQTQADDQKTQAPAQQTTPPVPPAPDRREDEPKWGRRQADRPESCPRCGVQVERGKLGSHNFHAHGEDRRAKSRDDKEGDKDKDGDKDAPKTPPRRDEKAPRSDGDGTRRKGRRKSRWDDTRKGWG